MPARYAPLSHNAQDAEHELDAAFESDDEDGTHPDQNPPSAESTGVSETSGARPASLPGTYNFEADFDYAVPPPGSPPGPSALAYPNQYGNTNGQLPSAPVVPPTGRRNFFRRAIGSILPTHYQRLASDEARPAVGGGTNNDGVFANLMAKPGRGRIVRDGESIHVVPEEVQKDTPPSYAVAQADAAPAYYETIVHAPASGIDGEVLVDAMPTGSIFTFAWTMLISLSFQFVGFLLTYLLHTSHASKYGSRAGLGVTIIQYAFFLRRRAALPAANQQYDSYEAWWEGETPEENTDLSSIPPVFNNTAPDALDPPYGPSPLVASATTEWVAFFLMTVGWFVLLTSLLGFWRVKRWEIGIRQASEPVPVPTQEDVERDRNVRANIMQVFGLFIDQDDEAHAGHEEPSRPATEEERQLERDLRASGLL